MGVHQVVQAENKGMKVPTDEDYRKEGLSGSDEGEE